METNFSSHRAETQSLNRRSPGVAAILLSAVILLSASRFAAAQVLYGSIVGNVTDSSGASVPGATVQITETQTNQNREAITNDSGTYTLTTVPAGTYKVAISKTGFNTYTAQNIDVKLNTVVRIDASLRVGAAQQTIEVSAQAAQLQTDRADVHTEFSSKIMVDLPQPTRSYQGVIGLMPGITPPTASNGGTNNPGKSMQFSANGTSRSGVNVRIDGVSATNPWVQFFSTAVPSMEAIETVNVVADSADAEQGMVNGAAVNVQIKSGTNDFHGSLYEYNESNALKARPFFLPANQGIPKLVHNDLGGTIGGRIVKDKLFFFGSFEGDYLHQGNGQFATVPTAAIRSGDMSQSNTSIYDPSTGNPDGTGRTAFAGNRIPVSSIASASQKLVALVPQPNAPGFANNYYVNTPISNTLQRVDTKYDWNATSKIRVTGRFSQQHSNVFQGTVFGDTLGGANNHIAIGDVYSYSISSTYIASPTFVVDGTWGLTWSNQTLSPPGTDKKYGSDVLGIPGTNLGTLPYAGGMPQFNISNYSMYGYAYTPLQYIDPVFQYTGNATWIKGAHNVRFGADVSQQHMNHFEISPTQFSFTGGVTALKGGPAPNQFNSYADFLLGLPNSDTNSLQTVPWITLRTWQFSVYIRDQWQLGRKLTLSYGTRWEYYPVPYRQDRGIERYDFTTNKMLVCGVGPTPKDCGIHVQKALFSPRLGIAYRPTENLVVRAGFALNPEQINMYRDGLYSYPTELTFNGSAANSYSPVTTLSQGIPVLTPPDISAGSVSLPPGATFTTDPQNFIRGYTESWNLTVEKNLGKGFLAQAGYVGTHTVHQHTRYNINYGLPGGGAASQAFYPLGVTGSIALILPFENMNYQSLQTSLGRRFSNGLQFQLAYTRSKWIGVCCDDSGDGGPAIPVPQYTSLNRALMSADRPNNLQISGIYELPFGKSKLWLNHGIGAALIGGWQINGIFSKYSGTPFSVSASGAALNAPGNTQRADQVKPDVAILGGVGSAPWFDPLAFASVNQARFGTAGFNTVRGPGKTNLDLSVFRNFHLTERWVLQFRAEALNASNTPHFSNPGANVSNMQLNSDGSINNLNGYGQITSTSAGSRTIDERFFRLGLRISF